MTAEPQMKPATEADAEPPMNAETRITDLIEIANDLMEIMLTENQALQENRSDAIKVLVDQKDALSRAYERGIDGLGKMPKAEITAVNLEIRERLKLAGNKLEKLGQENAKLLRVAIVANQSVIDAVAEAVKQSSPSGNTYGANGIQGAVERAPQSVPLSLDKTL